MTTEATEQQYARLPDKLKGVVNDPSVNKKIREIGKAHQLHIDQVGAIAEEVSNVLFGEIKAAELVGRITEHANLSQLLGKKIAEEISLAIFQPIRDDLRKLHDQEGEENLDQPSESRDDILNSIENPEQTPSVSRQHTPGEPAPQEVVVPAETPVIPTPPRPLVKVEEEKPKPSILERKKKEPFTAGADDVTSRINRDPYKESIG